METVMFIKIKTHPAYFSLLVGLILLACGTTFAQDVHYNVMPGADFSKYHTYKWIEIPNMQHPNQIVEQEIRDAVDGQLSSKGLTKTDGDKADLYVAFQTSIDKERQWNGFGDGFGPWGFGGGMATATSSTIENGTLVIDMYDPATRQLVWTGQATKTLDLGKNQQKNVEKLDKGIAKLFKNFP